MTNKTATKRYGQEVVYDDVFHALLAERRRTGSKSQRAQISKSIRKHLRRAIREQRNGRIKHVLDEFKDLDRLTHHDRAPVYPCPTRKNENCPGPDEFANFLENLHRKWDLNRLVSKVWYGKRKQLGFWKLNVSPWLNCKMH